MIENIPTSFLLLAGHYGAVYKAVYKHSDSDKQTEVAVKTLQGEDVKARSIHDEV